MKYLDIMGLLGERGEKHTMQSFNRQYIKMDPSYLSDCDRRSHGYLTDKGRQRLWASLKHYGHTDIAQLVLDDIERSCRIQMMLGKAK